MVELNGTIDDKLKLKVEKIRALAKELEMDQYLFMFRHDGIFFNLIEVDKPEEVLAILRDMYDKVFEDYARNLMETVSNDIEKLSNAMKTQTVQSGLH